MIDDNNKFGVEIEMTGISRVEAAEVLASHFGTYVDEIPYRMDKLLFNSWSAIDSKSRSWLFVKDDSIKPIPKLSLNLFGHCQDFYKTEMVTPILFKEDIPQLKQVISLLRKTGAEVNDSCSVHIHVDACNHTLNSLIYLINNWFYNQNLIYSLLNVNSARQQTHCKMFKTEQLTHILHPYPKSIEQLVYKCCNFWTSDGVSYPRNYGLNIYNVTHELKTVEFRIFNGTLDENLIEDYINFCLALTTDSISKNSEIKNVKEMVNQMLSSFKIANSIKEYNPKSTLTFLKAINLNNKTIDNLISHKEMTSSVNLSLL